MVMKMVGERYDGLSEEEKYERAIGEYAVTEEDAQLDEGEGAKLTANIHDIFDREKVLFWGTYGRNIYDAKRVSEKFPNIIVYEDTGDGVILYNTGDINEIKEKVDYMVPRYTLMSLIRDVKSLKRIAYGDMRSVYKSVISNWRIEPEIWRIEPEIAKAYIDSVARGLPSLEKEVVELIKLLVEEDQKFLQERYKNKDRWLDPFDSQPQLTKIEEELIEPIKKYGRIIAT